MLVGWRIIGPRLPGVPRKPVIVERAAFALLATGPQARLREPRPAVYLLRSRASRVAYVGQTDGAGGVWGRVASHVERSKFTGENAPLEVVVLWLRCSCALDYIESRLICYFKPPSNVQAGRVLQHVPRPGLWCDYCRRGTTRP